MPLPGERHPALPEGAGDGEDPAEALRVPDGAANAGAPGASLFGFSETPPWSLADCVEKAVAWLEKNRGKFPNAPPPAKKPEG